MFLGNLLLAAFVATEPIVRPDLVLFVPQGSPSLPGRPQWISANITRNHKLASDTFDVPIDLTRWNAAALQKLGGKVEDRARSLISKSSWMKLYNVLFPATSTVTSASTGVMATSARKMSKVSASHLVQKVNMRRLVDRIQLLEVSDILSRKSKPSMNVMKTGELERAETLSTLSSLFDMLFGGQSDLESDSDECQSYPDSDSDSDCDDFSDFDPCDDFEYYQVSNFTNGTNSTRRHTRKGTYHIRNGTYHTRNGTNHTRNGTNALGWLHRIKYSNMSADIEPELAGTKSFGIHVYAIAAASLLAQFFL